MMIIPNNDEQNRLIQTYRNYLENEAVQKQWSAANPGNRAMIDERLRVLGQMLKENGFMPLANRRILDIGSGSGEVLASLTPWGASPKNLFGVELVPEQVEAAKRKFPGIHFTQGNAERMDFEENFFELILFFTIFTSILDERMAHNVAEEGRRVLKPSGMVVWYDFRYDNPYNHNVRGMTKEAIRRLFPNFDLKLRSVTLFPPLARRLGCATTTLYPILSNVPFLRTHYAGTLVKPE